ncbi:hypothetical protein LCGC14_1725970 [marine sediment metagenome]|uniref:Uncharacterized protein n=1 Tax=marine sediment metagenome TaxID=412755 RepID=A0A0F9HAT2_9ZZZZ
MSDTAVEQFWSELEGLLKRHSLENGLTYVEALGVLCMVRAKLEQDVLSDDDDNDVEESDITS